MTEPDYNNTNADEDDDADTGEDKDVGAGEDKGEGVPLFWYKSMWSLPPQVSVEFPMHGKSQSNCRAVLPPFDITFPQSIALNHVINI